MAPSGMQMMLRSLGVDPDEIKGNVQAFMDTMKAAVEKVEANQLRIEAKLDRIERLIEQPGEAVHIKEEGKDTGVLITTERFPQALLDEMMF